LMCVNVRFHIVALLHTRIWPRGVWV
jgi:hypothetical protein